MGSWGDGVTGARNGLAVIVTVLIASCAGGNGASDFDSYSIRVREDARGYRYAFDAPTNRVVEALPEVYTYFGFPGGLATSTDDLLFISPTATAEGRIYAEEPNSLYLDCGRVLGGPRADTHILQFALVTRIVALDTGGSEVEIIIDGRARDRVHQTNAVPCRGTGKLEGQVAALLGNRLRGSSS